MKSKFLVLIVLSALVLTQSSQADYVFPIAEGNLNLISSSDAGISFRISVPWRETEINVVSMDGIKYSKVYLPNWTAIGTAGNPELPVLSATFAVPFDAELSLNIEPGKIHQIELDHPVLPIPEQIMDETNQFDGIKLSNLPNPTFRYHANEMIYSGQAAFPGVGAKITNEGILRNQRLIGITVYPFQYHPGADLLEIYEDVRVDVIFKGGISSTNNSKALESVLFEDIYRQTITNYESAISWRNYDLSRGFSASKESQSGKTHWNVPSPAWRIMIANEGFYKLTYSELENAGVPVESLELSSYQMFWMGSEIDIQVIDENSNDLFDPEDLIIFYGCERENKYSSENVYWLTFDADSQGLRMAERDVSPDPVSPSPIAADFLNNNHFEKNLYYASSIPGSDTLDRFVWGFINSTHSVYNKITTNFTLPEIAQGGAERLMLALVGYTNDPTNPNDHRAVVKINGVEVADANWDGREWKIIDVPLPTNLLTVGSNQLEIFGPNAFFDVFYFDWFEIESNQLFYAKSDAIDFNFPETGAKQQFMVNGFSTETIAAYDISIGNKPVLLTGLSIQSDAEDLFDVKFEDTIDSDMRYWVSTMSNLLSSNAIIKDIPSDLSNESNEADYLVITHELFENSTELNDLMNLRSSQGLQVKKVNVQDIYDEFNHGFPDAAAIKNFLEYTYYQWTKAPSVVLLVGDGHYNPKNYSPGKEGFGRTSFIPPYLSMVDPIIGETASDNRYVTFVGEDNLPDMLIGRLAVNSNEEISAFINKIVEYEGSIIDGDWNLSVTLAADNPDGSGNFQHSSEYLRSCCIHDYYQQDRIYLGITHSTADLAKSALITSINGGKFLINYIGHGAYSEWAGWDSNPDLSGSILKASDVAGFTNHGKYPIVLAMSCAEGMFHFPHPLGSYQESMAEVITKASSKGAVASWSPAGWGLATGHDVLDQGFVRAALRNRVRTLSQATTAGLVKLWSTGDFLDLIDTYMIFGDPALVLRHGPVAIPDSFSTTFDQSLVVSQAEGILKNDIIPGSLPVAVELVSGPIFGELTFNEDGSFTYIPDAGFYGKDSFYYRIAADEGQQFQYSNDAKVSINVTFSLYLPMILR